MSTPLWLPNLIKPATGTDVGGKKSLDVYVSGGVLSFDEVATAADGDSPPAQLKIIGGVSAYDGLVHEIVTDDFGALITQRSWVLDEATDSVSTTNGSIISAANSTITPLAGAGTFTGTGEDITQHSAIQILMVTDQNGSLIPEYSNNNINWDGTEAYPIVVTTPGVSQSFGFSFMTEAQYFRLRYVNGATPQGNFKVQTALKVNAPGGEIHPIGTVLTSRMEAICTKGVIYGQTTAGGGAFVAVKVSPSGAISADVTGTVAATQSGTWNVNSSDAGYTKANAPTRNDYTSVNVTTAAYVQLVASTTAATKEIEIFDSSGQLLVLATGAAASEVDQIYIMPGGNGRVKLAIPASTRVSVKAVSATASVGQLAINWFA